MLFIHSWNSVSAVSTAGVVTLGRVWIGFLCCFPSSEKKTMGKDNRLGEREEQGRRWGRKNIYCLVLPCQIQEMQHRWQNTAFVNSVNIIWGTRVAMPTEKVLLAYAARCMENLPTEFYRNNYKNIYVFVTLQLLNLRAHTFYRYGFPCYLQTQPRNTESELWQIQGSSVFSSDYWILIPMQIIFSSKAQEIYSSKITATTSQSPVAIHHFHSHFQTSNLRYMEARCPSNTLVPAARQWHTEEQHPHTRMMTSE